jgi:hypothetical protein
MIARVEADLGTDPFTADTDGDGISDRVETDAGHDPTVAAVRNPGGSYQDCDYTGTWTLGDVEMGEGDTVINSSCDLMIFRGDFSGEDVDWRTEGKVLIFRDVDARSFTIVADKIKVGPRATLRAAVSLDAFVDLTTLNRGIIVNGAIEVEGAEQASITLTSARKVDVTDATLSTSGDGEQWMDITATKLKAERVVVATSGEGGAATLVVSGNVKLKDSILENVDVFIEGQAAGRSVTLGGITTIGAVSLWMPDEAAAVGWRHLGDRVEFYPAEGD